MNMRNLQIEQGQGVERTPIGTRLTPPKKEPLDRATRLASGADHTIQKAGSYQISSGATGATKVSLAAPGVVGGPVTVVNSDGRSMTLRVVGGTINGAQSFDATDMGGVTLQPGQGSDWVVIPHAPKVPRVKLYARDPSSPQDGDIWFNTTDGALRVCVGDTIV